MSPIPAPTDGVRLVGFRFFSLLHCEAHADETIKTGAPSWSVFAAGARRRRCARAGAAPEHSSHPPSLHTLGSDARPYSDRSPLLGRSFCPRPGPAAQNTTDGGDVAQTHGAAALGTQTLLARFPQLEKMRPCRPRRSNANAKGSLAAKLRLDGRTLHHALPPIGCKLTAPADRRMRCPSQALVDDAAGRLGASQRLQTDSLEPP